jgi:hypothetical protein
MWPMAQASAITVQQIDKATAIVPAAPEGAPKEKKATPKSKTDDKLSDMRAFWHVQSAQNARAVEAPATAAIFTLRAPPAVTPGHASPGSYTSINAAPWQN